MIVYRYTHAPPDYLLFCFQKHGFRVLSRSAPGLFHCRNTTYAENSPSLWPTISSVIVTS